MGSWLFLVETAYSMTRDRCEIWSSSYKNDRQNAKVIVEEVTYNYSNDESQLCRARCSWYELRSWKRMTGLGVLAIIISTYLWEETKNADDAMMVRRYLILLVGASTWCLQDICSSIRGKDHSFKKCQVRQ